MVLGIMERTNMKVIAEIKISDGTGAEKMQALKDILVKAGLLVDIDGCEITILERVLNGQHNQGAGVTGHPD